MRNKITTLLIFLVLFSSIALASKPTIPPEMLIPRTTIYGEVISSQNNILKVDKIVSDCKKDSGIIDIETTQDYADLIGQKAVIIAKKQDNKLIFDRLHYRDIEDYKQECANNIGARLFTEIIKETTPSGDVVQIQEIMLEQETDTRIPFRIKNNNDQAVRYKFKEFITYDLIKMNPGGFSEKPISERKENAKVNFCTVTFPTEEGIINAGEEKQFEAIINCQDVSCVKPRIYDDRCKFTTLPTIEFFTPFDEWAETTKDSYLNHNYYVKSEEQSEVSSNLGSECSTSAGCLNGICLFCPADTQFNIQIDADPYAVSNCEWLKEKYGDKAQCQSEENIFKISGGNQGYCGYGHTAKCTGNWNGDSYYINYYYSRDRDCVGNQCVETEEKLSLTKFLTQDVLGIWKEEVLKMISENYFNENFDVEYMNGMVTINEGGNHEFEARIYYNFKLGWAENEQAGQGSSWTRIKVAEKRNGEWKKVTKEEMAASYRAELERWHNLGKVRPTEYEIDSLISQEEAVKKLRECHKDIKIDNILLDSENQKLVFTASGKVNLDTQNCEESPHNSYTVVLGRVDLQTGEVECKRQQSACAVFETGVGEVEKGAIEPSQIYPPKEEKVGFFKKIINWFGRLFS